MKKRISVIALFSLLAFVLGIPKILGIPAPRNEKPEVSIQPSTKPHSPVSPTAEPVWELEGEVSAPEPPSKEPSEAKALRQGPLSPEEEEALKRASYPAFIRYQAKVLNPERITTDSQDTIIRERIVPKLLQHLETRKTASEKDEVPD